MTTDVSRETTPPTLDLPMVRVRTRRVNPITIGTPVQITALLCLTFIVLAIVGMIGGA